MTAPVAMRTAATVGVGTTVLGGGLAYAPDAVAAALGLRRPEPVRIIGLADLALAPGLIAGRPRWRWMAARAALNVAIIAYLLDETRRTSEPRPRTAALGLAALTVGDGATAWSLRRTESRPGHGG